MVAGPVGGIDDRTVVHRLDARDPRPDVRRPNGHAPGGLRRVELPERVRHYRERRGAGPGHRDRFPTPGECDRLAPACGRARVGADGVLSCVRAPRAGRRARLTSGRTGRGVDRERTLADPGGHAPLPLPALPDRTSVVASVEAGAMVRDRVARTAPGRHRRLRDLGVERAVHPRRHGSIGWILRAHAVRGRPLPPADRRWRVVRFGRGPVSRSRSGTSASSSSGS